ncbi:hypothetical protein LINPERHAP1_LOCUS34719 [Linum perenne]
MTQCSSYNRVELAVLPPSDDAIGIEDGDEEIDVCGDFEEGVVSDFVNDDGSWNLTHMRRYLDEDIVVEIVVMLPPSADQEEDNCVWGLEINGKFTIRTAYDLVYDSSQHGAEID